MSDTITIPSSSDNGTSKLEKLTEGAIENGTVSHEVNEDNRSPSLENNNTTQESQTEGHIKKNEEGVGFKRIDENPTVDLGNETSKDTGISNYEIDEVGEVHVIHPAAPIQPGNYSLEIEYEVPLNNCAIFVSNFTVNGETR